MPDLTVVIPSFNSAPWLPSTLAALDIAVAKAHINAQVVVVDDGSTDNTAEVLNQQRELLDVDLTVVVQQNRGRFLARWAGLEVAQAPTVLLLDSRVIIDEGAIEYAWTQSTVHRAAWNGHIDTASDGPLVGLFWEVPTRAFWSHYTAKPRPLQVAIRDFDRVPKGTTMFMADRELLRECFERNWPEGNAHLISDDTKILRDLTAKHGFYLDPSFSATYRPRVHVRAFLKHGFDRGTLFVDSYWGTSRSRNIILVLLGLAPIVAAAGIAWPETRIPVLFLAAIALMLVLTIPPLVPGNRHTSLRAKVAYVLWAVPLGIAFTGGVMRGLAMRMKSARKGEGS